MTTPTEIMERLKTLPEHLQPHHRRFIVEATSDETKAPQAEFWRLTEEARLAAMGWAKKHGAEGFYPPSRSWGGEPSNIRALSFKRDKAPNDSAWIGAGRGYEARHGYVALKPSKRPAGKALQAEVDALPKWPGYGTAIDHLGAITDLCTEGEGGRVSNGSVGYSDGKVHFTVPCQVGDRYFISAVNHNYDIFQQVESAINYLAGDHPEYAPSLDFKDDPIGWRPGPGWTFLTKTEFDFIVAQARLEAEKKAA